MARTLSLRVPRFDERSEPADLARAEDLLDALPDARIERSEGERGAREVVGLQDALLPPVETGELEQRLQVGGIVGDLHLELLDGHGVRLLQREAVVPGSLVEELAGLRP